MTATSTSADWDPAQYNKFREERMRPFFDLVELIRVRPAMRVVDLGCGTGELTALLAERLPDASVLGIDASAPMLRETAGREGPRVKFEQRDIRAVNDYQDLDLVFSHAALQWVPDNESALPRILDAMKPGAQIAVQVPNNFAHPSHTVAAEVACEQRFRPRLEGVIAPVGVLTMERYAEILHEHGFRDQVLFEKIYGNAMASTGDVVEWVKGTLLRAYLSRLDADDQRAFLTAYRERLIAAVGDHAPYFYPFRRMLFWAEKNP